ncbi:two-component system LytT family response regulator [Inquilinus ginsengisoli]|jgi:two-component system response regulator AlgR|uniref:LytR/AlgR family response regulator transcription factor n=1 Tax=Inquilinus ginsengisoli TaxID=363840 RepID=UPI003D202CB8
MSEVTVLVVEDEPLARRRLARQLASIGGMRLVGEAGDADQACDLVRDLAPDVMLLDIQLPGGTGFDVLDRLGANAPAVVFVTAFDHHALRAFDASAVDYVTKPVDEGRLRAALSRARQAVQARKSEEHLAELRETVSALRQALRKHEGRAAEFWVKSKGAFLRIPSEQVTRFQADRDYVRIHAGDGAYFYQESLASLERRLDPTEFVRIHRSTIVRRDCIAKLRQAPFAALIAVMTDGGEIRIGRTYSKAMRDALLRSR